MLEIIKQRLEKIDEERMKMLILREELQLLLLKIIYELGYFGNLAFVGGTALRILFGLQRFSEDLDFCLVDSKDYHFKKLADRVNSQLKKYALPAAINVKESKTVQNVMFRFEKVLSIFGLAKLKEQKLSVKMEVDTHPPKGWNLEISLVSKSQIFSVTHYDIPSLYASKLHSCFFRRFVKGRDFYDLVWYLGKNIMPNFELLNNAIYQTEHRKLNISGDNFKNFLKESLEKVDFARVRQDVEKFLENRKEVELLRKDLILSLINK